MRTFHGPSRRNPSQVEIAAVATLGIVLSCAGQNSVLGVFLDHQSKTLGIDEVHFCILLAGATLLAAGGMRWFETAVAQWPTARLAWMAGTTSAASLALWAVLIGTASRLSLAGASILLILSLTGIRLFLRGVLKIVAASVVNETVAQQHRARVMAISSAVAGVIFAGMPLATHGMLNAWGFSWTIGVYAAGSLAVGILTARVVSARDDGAQAEAQNAPPQAELRNAPPQAELRNAPPQAQPRNAPPQAQPRNAPPQAQPRNARQKVRDERPVDMTLTEAKQAPLFWTYAAGLPLNTLIQSSASLMILPIARQAGVEPNRVYSIYVLAMIVGLPCVYFATVNMRRHRAIFRLHQAALIVSTVGFITISNDAGWVAAGVGFGAAAGLYTAMASNLWPTVYGLRHAKAFYGFATAIDLAASAAGPLLFGVVHSFFGVQAALWLVLPLPVLTILSSLRAGQRDEHQDDTAPMPQERRTARLDLRRNEAGSNSAIAPRRYRAA